MVDKIPSKSDRVSVQKEEGSTSKNSLRTLAEKRFLEFQKKRDGDLRPLFLFTYKPIPDPFEDPSPSPFKSLFRTIKKLFSRVFGSEKKPFVIEEEKIPPDIFDDFEDSSSR